MLNELQLETEVLGFLHEKRDDYDGFQYDVGDLPSHIPPRVFFRAWKNLADRGLATFRPVLDGMEIRWAQGRITGLGIEEKEGRAKRNGSTVAQTITINGSNIHGSQIGTVNSTIQNLSLSQLAEAIEGSNASVEDKSEAKSRLQKFLEHPLITSIAGGLAGAAGGLVAK